MPFLVNGKSKAAMADDQLAIMEWDLTLVPGHKNESHILALLENVKAVVNVSAFCIF